MTTLQDKIIEIKKQIAILQAKIVSLQESIKEDSFQYQLDLEKIPSKVMTILDGEVVHADEIQLPIDSISKTISANDVHSIIKSTYNVTF